jgi:uncharacterized protein YggT (Ycf19 family)
VDDIFTKEAKEMANHSSVPVDESNRTAQYEEVKGRVQREVNAEIASHADQLNQNEREQAAAVGGQLKHKALKEVVDTDTEVERSRAIARFSQFVDYVFYLIYGLIALQITLDLLGARRGNGFRNFIDTITWPLLAPFNSLMPSVGSGSFQLRLSYIFALVVYLLLHMAINGLLRLLGSRKTVI